MFASFDRFLDGPVDVDSYYELTQRKCELGSFHSERYSPESAGTNTFRRQNPEQHTRSESLTSNTLVRRTLDAISQASSRLGHSFKGQTQLTYEKDERLVMTDTQQLKEQILCTTGEQDELQNLPKPVEQQHSRKPSKPDSALLRAYQDAQVKKSQHVKTPSDMSFKNILGGADFQVNQSYDLGRPAVRSTLVRDSHPSPKLSAHERLYQDSLERRTSREKKAQEYEFSRDIKDMLHGKDGGHALSSRSVSKKRQKGNNVQENPHNDFLEYSMEWQRLRDAKIIKRKLEKEQKLMEDSRPVHPPVQEEKLPYGYKGPVSDYQSHIQQFFLKKQFMLEVSMRRSPGIPQINSYQQAESYLKRSRSKDFQLLSGAAGVRPMDTSESLQNLVLTDEMTQSTSIAQLLPVEERLIRKGEKYKQQLNERRRDMLIENIVHGPSFKPKLIANNEPYLQRRQHESSLQSIQGDLEHTDELNPSHLLTRSLLKNGHQFYYDAMLHLVHKQKRLLEHMQEFKRDRVPQINEYSRTLAESDPQRVSVFHREPFKAPQGSPVKHVFKVTEDEDKVRERRAKIEGFLKRNYEKALHKKQQEQDKHEGEGHFDTFKPQLSAGTLQLLQQRCTESKSAIPSFEQLYAQAKKLKEKKERRERERLEEVAKKELEGVTFRPQVNTHHAMPKVIAPKSQQVVKKKKEVKEYVPKTLETKRTSVSTYLTQHLKTKQTTTSPGGYLQQYQQAKNAAQDQSLVFTDRDEEEEAHKLDGQMMRKQGSIESDLRLAPIGVSDFNHTLESNLLDFNEERFNLDTACAALYNSSASDLKEELKKESKHFRGGSDIHGFLDDMMHSNSTLEMAAVIEDAKRALLECETSSEGSDESPLKKLAMKPQQHKPAFQPPFNSNANPILEEDQEGDTHSRQTSQGDNPSQTSSQGSVVINAYAQEADLASVLRGQSHKPEEELKESSQAQNAQNDFEKLSDPIKGQMAPPNLIMNKTLSLIEEEEAEEYMTQGDVMSSDIKGMSLGGSQKIYIEDTLKDLSLQGSPQHIQMQNHSHKISLDIAPLGAPELPGQAMTKPALQPPAIVRDIETMERDFTSFLESIYS